MFKCVHFYVFKKYWSCNTCSEIKLLKWLSHLPEANELKMRESDITDILIISNHTAHFSLTCHKYYVTGHILNQSYQKYRVEFAVRTLVCNHDAYHYGICCWSLLALEWTLIFTSYGGSHLKYKSNTICLKNCRSILWSTWISSM